MPTGTSSSFSTTDLAFRSKSYLLGPNADSGTTSREAARKGIVSVSWTACCLVDRTSDGSVLKIVLPPFSCPECIAPLVLRSLPPTPATSPARIRNIQKGNRATAPPWPSGDVPLSGSRALRPRLPDGLAPGNPTGRQVGGLVHTRVGFPDESRLLAKAGPGCSEFEAFQREAALTAPARPCGSRNVRRQGSTTLAPSKPARSQVVDLAQVGSPHD